MGQHEQQAGCKEKRKEKEDSRDDQIRLPPVVDHQSQSLDRLPHSHLIRKDSTVPISLFLLSHPRHAFQLER